MGTLIGFRSTTKRLLGLRVLHTMRWSTQGWLNGWPEISQIINVPKLYCHSYLFRDLAQHLAQCRSVIRQIIIEDGDDPACVRKLMPSGLMRISAAKKNLLINKWHYSGWPITTLLYVNYFDIHVNDQVHFFSLRHAVSPSSVVRERIYWKTNFKNANLDCTSIYFWNFPGTLSLSQSRAINKSLISIWIGWWYSIVRSLHRLHCCCFWNELELYFQFVMTRWIYSNNPGEYHLECRLKEVMYIKVWMCLIYFFDTIYLWRTRDCYWNRGFGGSRLVVSNISHSLREGAKVLLVLKNGVIIQKGNWI